MGGGKGEYGMEWWTEREVNEVRRRKKGGNSRYGEGGERVKGEGGREGIEKKSGRKER